MRLWLNTLIVAVAGTASQHRYHTLLTFGLLPHHHTTRSTTLNSCLQVPPKGKNHRERGRTLL
jgi:hypothetical protein